MNDNFKELKGRIRKLDELLTLRGTGNLDFAQAVSAVRRAVRHGDRTRNPSPSCARCSTRPRRSGGCSPRRPESAAAAAPSRRSAAGELESGEGSTRERVRSEGTVARAGAARSQRTALRLTGGLLPARGRGRTPSVARLGAARHFAADPQKPLARPAPVVRRLPPEGRMR